MGTVKSESLVEKILSLADIDVNGLDPWDIRVYNDDFYSVVVQRGSLGLGETYMEGWWDCERLDDFFSRIIPLDPEEMVGKDRELLLHSIKCSLMNMGKRSRAFEVGRKHYDIGNELYRCMLDKRMIYSCAYWKDAQTLDNAQEAKLDLICRKIGIKSGDKILDIGCGWGGFAKYAAENYGAQVVGITVSREQAELAEDICRGLPVEIRLQDYRDINETFDHVVSVGMFEHAGLRNYRTYFEKVSKCLKDGGLFLLHTIGLGSSRSSNDAWMNKYIFPNYSLPSMKQIATGIEGLFVVEDWHHFDTYYDTTLRHWFRNFDGAWDMLKKHYDDRFYRMWKYYLLSCAGAFRCRYLHVWQIVLSRKGIMGGYQSVR